MWGLPWDPMNIISTITDIMHQYMIYQQKPLPHEDPPQTYKHLRERTFPKMLQRLGHFEQRKCLERTILGLLYNTVIIAPTTGCYVKTLKAQKVLPLLAILNFLNPKNVQKTKGGLPDSSVGQESAWNTGDKRDLCSIPGSGRSSGEGHGNPLQYSCLENPVDRGAWRATVGIAKSQAEVKWLSTEQQG